MTSFAIVKASGLRRPVHVLAERLAALVVTMTLMFGLLLIARWPVLADDA